MESEKYRSSSDISSEETDQIKDDKTSRKRSYEWTFCKRGFTNVKASGGHMNIHRKDRAKAKQTNSSSSSKFNEEYLYPTYPPSTVTSESSSPRMYYPILKGRRNYNMCFQLPPAAAVVSNASRDPYGCFNQAPVLSSNQEQLLGANLSLRVGSAIVEDLVNDDELDLELRLGNDH